MRLRRVVRYGLPLGAVLGATFAVIWDLFSGHPEPAEAAVFGIIGGLPIGAVIAAAIPTRHG